VEQPGVRAQRRADHRRPPTRNKGEVAYMLCLFDKQTAKVEIQEIEAPLFK
jgi:hypothetical protein